jgi:tetratricopeptide (TPR) repeat protein
VGKTALAVHAAHQLLEQFPGGHLYADLRGYTEGQDPAGPGEVLQVFLRRLGVPAEEVPAEIEERSGLLRQLMADRRVLMVLDNARSEGQVRPLLPGAGGSLVLVTSRSVLPGLEVDERISLDTLPPDEAAAMLSAIIGSARAGAEPQAVAEVARLCGRLPLALRIAGQILAAHPRWPAGRLVRLLTDERDRLARLGAGDLQVRATFEVSYAQLAEEDARVFRLLGLHPGPDFTAPSAAALAGTGPEAAGPVLDRLAGAHLVTEDASGRFGMHDLLRLYARGSCQEADSPADRDAAEARLVGYYADLAKFLDSCVNPLLRPVAQQAAERDGGTLPSMREALAAFQAERPGLLAALGLAAERGWDEQVRRLSSSTTDSLTILRYLDDLLSVAEAALAAARHGRDRTAEGVALGNLGGAYRALRRLEEAVDCYQQSLAIFRETGNLLCEGVTLNNLGNAYAELRRLEEGVDCYQQSLAIERETGDRHGEGQTLGNLGNAYRALRRLEEAVDYYQQSLAIFRETGDRHGEGQTLNNLGNAYQALRRLEEAVDYYQQSLAIERETGDRHGEGQTLNNLGNAYYELRRLEEAVDCYQRDIAICRETGDRHGEGRTLGNLGEAYYELRRLEEAVSCYQQSLAIFRETGDRQGEGTALDKLGSAYQELRRSEEAVSCYQQSLAIFRETGDRHGEGRTLANLGFAYRELREPVRAAGCWWEAAAAMRDAGHHGAARRLGQLAVDNRPQRRWSLRRGSSS